MWTKAAWGMVVVLGASAMGCDGSSRDVATEGRTAATGAALLGQQAILSQPDGVSGDDFGYTLGIDGDTAVVGMSHLYAGATGHAYIFVRSGSTWALQAELPNLSQYFGASVAISGDAVAVADGIRSVYMFRRSGTTWTLESTVLVDMGDGGGMPIPTVALDGDTLLVGSMEGVLVGRSVVLQAAARVYTRSGTAWPLEQQLSISLPSGLTAFNTSSVAIRGDTAVLGFSNAHNGTYVPGAALAYHRTAGAWTLQAYLQPNDLLDGDGLGWSVALSAGEDAALVTARYRSASYVFRRAGSTWSQEAELPAAGVGAIEGGNAYVCLTSCTHYELASGAWNATETLAGASSFGLDATPPGPGTYYPTAAAVSNGTLLVGAPKYQGSGGAYVFAPTTPPAISATCTDTPCVPSSTIGATFSGLAGNASDWVAIAEAGSALDTNVGWVFTGGSVSGSHAFGSLPPGTYVARAFSGSLTLVAESAPVIVAPSQASSSMTVSCAPACTSTDVVQVTYAGMPGYTNDWIAVIQSGHADSAYERYQYTSGATAGSVSFGTLPPGTYVARGFQQGSFGVVVSSAAFTVTAPAPVTTTLDAVVTGPGAVSVTYAGLAGYNHDWIGLAPAGGAATSDVAWVYSFGAPSGTASFSGIAPGTYVARAFFDDSFTIAAESASFVVP